MILDNGFENGFLEFFVAMDCDVTKSDHVFHGNSGFFADEGVLQEQIKGIPTALGNAEATLCDVVHCEVNGGLAGAEEIEDDGILNGEIIESLGVTL